MCIWVFCHIMLVCALLGVYVAVCRFNLLYFSARDGHCFLGLGLFAHRTVYVCFMLVLVLLIFICLAILRFGAGREGL